MAQGIVLNDEELRTDLNWLDQQGVIQISTSTWPLSGDEIERALNHAKILNNTQQKVIDSVKAVLNKENAPVKFDLSIASDQAYSPQQFGMNAKAQYVASAELNAGQAHWDAKLRVNAEKDQIIDHGHDINVEGSYLAGKLWNQWVIAGQIPTYWGPGHEGSLIRGDASRPVYGLTMQRAEQNAFETKWLSWIGDWQYQIFAGQLDDYNIIPHAKLLGMRVTAKPLPYLEFGGSRTLQWGGKGRSESWDTLWNAIKGNDNFDDGDLDKSNQIAGLDARLNLQQWLNAPVSVYGQFVGEDEAGFMPAKKMYLAGIDFSSQIKDMPYQIYGEWVDTRTNGEVQGISYNHYIYKDGYYQHGFPLGHSLGGDGEMYSVGGNIRIDLMNRLSGRAISATVNESNLSINEAFPNKDEIKALDLTWTHYLKPTLPLEIKAWVSDSDLHGRDTGASLGIEIPLDNILFKH
ncbi:capsule assembly Wzi family protein [Acinetobacter sp. ANC 7201]|uniref:capsule assembly Wzi family protein n=1 Tax=Acinetobacter sp. ANC 7201 TaxID=3035288 RepID=UPI00279D98E5|nr:capsule assembly Wzi family protein [Acinetobacter sp. ANC 7201]WFP96876.1 capsule assembly Wzi family protein [Acinetobacter sp. ANC 7201]